MTEPEDVNQPGYVQIRQRQALFDIVTDPVTVAVAMGLPPISDEVAEMEKRDAQLRAKGIERLMPAIKAHSSWMAHMFTGNALYQAKTIGVDVTAIDWDAMSARLEMTIGPSCQSVVSMLVDLGAIHIDEAWANTSEVDNG